MVIGILALQGDFQQHWQMLNILKVTPKMIKTADDLRECAALIIPGGESTVMSKFLEMDNLHESIIKFAVNHSVMGTCAGAILMSKNPGDDRIKSLGLIDMNIERNAYGSQIDSFCTEIEIDHINGEKKFPAYFIRAPKITAVGRPVKILARHNDLPILVRQNQHLAMTFHPELTDDSRIHQYFIKIIA